MPECKANQGPLDSYLFINDFVAEFTCLIFIFSIHLISIIFIHYFFFKINKTQKICENLE